MSSTKDAYDSDTGTGRIDIQTRRVDPNPNQFAFPHRKALLIFLTGLLLASIFLKGSRDLPADYALCSKEGKIYTVDESNPQTDCIVVRGNKIVDWGRVGKHYI